jgi:hypothetical protein
MPPVYPHQWVFSELGKQADITFSLPMFPFDDDDDDDWELE